MPPKNRDLLRNPLTNERLVHGKLKSRFGPGRPHHPQIVSVLTLIRTGYKVEFRDEPEESEESPRPEPKPMVQDKQVQPPTDNSSVKPEEKKEAPANSAAQKEAYAGRRTCGGERMNHVQITEPTLLEMDERLSRQGIRRKRPLTKTGFEALAAKLPFGARRTFLTLLALKPE